MRILTLCLMIVVVVFTIGCTSQTVGQATSQQQDTINQSEANAIDVNNNDQTDSDFGLQVTVGSGDTDKQEQPESKPTSYAKFTQHQLDVVGFTNSGRVVLDTMYLHIRALEDNITVNDISLSIATRHASQTTQLNPDIDCATRNLIQAKSRQEHGIQGPTRLNTGMTTQLCVSPPIVFQGNDQFTLTVFYQDEPYYEQVIQLPSVFQSSTIDATAQLNNTIVQ